MHLRIYLLFRICKSNQFEYSTCWEQFLINVFHYSQDVSNNVVEFTIHVFTLVYNISEIFMITHFGNEIMMSSDRLSYKLYESDWYVHTKQVKMCVIIFGECLKQPQVLMTGKIYPLTLETFTNVWELQLGLVCMQDFWTNFLTDFELCLQHVQHFEKH